MARSLETKTNILTVSTRTSAAKSRSRAILLWIAGLVILYLIVACLILQMWRTFIPLFDLVVDTRNAVALIHDGVIPKHGSVASYLVVNAPGVTAGLVPGLLLLPTEPALAEHVDDLLLFALTLAGVFALVAKRFGNATAFYCCAFYMLSTTGIYFADFMRPRAHPVFLVWLLFFLDKWVAEKSPRAFAIAVFIYIAANFWLLEFLPALMLFIIAWAVYRPRLPRLSLVVAVAAGFLLWSPYLVYESHDDFNDLRCLFARRCPITDWDGVYREVLTNPNLLMVEGNRVHDLHGGPIINTNQVRTEATSGGPPEPQYDWIVEPGVGMCYKAKLPVILENFKGFWLCPAGSTDWWFMSMDRQRWYNIHAGWNDHGPKNPPKPKNIFRRTFRAFRKICAKPAPLLLAPFPECAGTWGQPILCAVTICGIVWLAVSILLARLGVRSPVFSWTLLDEKARACLVLTCLAGVGPWLMLLLLVEPTDPELSRRFLWLWVALAAFTVLFLRQVLKRLSPLLAHGAVIALIIMTACNPNLDWRIRYLATNHFHAAPINEFNQIVDAIAAQAKAEGRTSLAVGYDIPFVKWILYARHVDGAQKVGGEFDLMLRLRHGITNTDNRCEGISPDDDFRIVEHESNESGRQTLFDLSGYPRMDVFLETPRYTVLRKPKG